MINIPDEQTISEWRRRAGLPPEHPEAMTLDDYREAIKVMRADRTSASVASQAKKAAAPAAKVAEILKDW